MMTVPRPSGILVLGVNQTIVFSGPVLVSTQEKELDPLTEYKVTRDGGDQDDGLPGWLPREVRDHDRRRECDGQIFVDGKAAIVNDAPDERTVDQSGVNGELTVVNRFTEPGLGTLIEWVGVEELNERNVQFIGSEVTAPDAALRPVPAKHTESDPVVVAAARVAAKRQELDQLDSRRIATGADIESEMQRVLQDAVDIITEAFGNMSDRVVSEIRAGDGRERVGRRALPHIEDAMVAVKAVVASHRDCGAHEVMDKIALVFGPLHLAYNCLAAGS